MTGKFGWCYGADTADHEHCRVAYTDWNGKPRQCSCECHTKPRKQRTIKIKRTKRETP